MLVKEYIDWAGRWVPDKPDKVKKSREYFWKQDLLKKLIDHIEKYKDKVNKNDLAEIINEIKERYNVS